jgi:hypothetical protein
MAGTSPRPTGVEFVVFARTPIAAHGGESPTAGQGRSRGVEMTRLLPALHPRGASQYVTDPRPEPRAYPLVISSPDLGVLAVTAAAPGVGEDTLSTAVSSL